MGYVGFNKLSDKLAKEPGVKNPDALAASIGDKKYGKPAMKKAAATRHSLRGVQALIK